MWSNPPALVLHEVSGVDFLYLSISVRANAAILGLDSSEEEAVEEDPLKFHREKKLEEGFLRTRNVISSRIGIKGMKNLLDTQD
jgi:hypothetical protein